MPNLAMKQLLAKQIAATLLRLNEATIRLHTFTVNVPINHEYFLNECSHIEDIQASLRKLILNHREQC